MDSKAEKKKYFLMNGKIYANRFSTDCFSDYFNDMARKSKVGLMDYIEYATEKASVDELKKQNSYFINALYKDAEMCIRDRLYIIKIEYKHVSHFYELYKRQFGLLGKNNAVFMQICLPKSARF